MRAPARAAVWTGVVALGAGSALLAQSAPAAGRFGGHTFPGEIVAKPQLTADVTAPLWGKIHLEKGVVAGARVTRGQRLATVVLELSAAERFPLDDRTLQIDGYLDLARQKLRFALADYQRAVRISEKDPDFAKEVERRKAIYENALKEFQAASQQRATQEGVIKSRDPKTTVITAPMDAYVEEVHFFPGEVNPTDEFRKLFTLVDLSTVLVRVEIYEKDLSLFRAARRVEVTSAAHAGESFEGSFLTVGGQIDPDNRTIPIFYEVSNPDEKLKLGFRVQVRPSL